MNKSTSPKKASQDVAQRRYDSDEPVEVPQSPLENIFSNSIIQNQRLYELNNLAEELLTYLGFGSPEQDSNKLSPAPYGRLEEIRMSQDGVFQNINDLETRIYALRRALM